MMTISSTPTPSGIFAGSTYSNNNETLRTDKKAKAAKPRDAAVSIALWQAGLLLTYAVIALQFYALSRTLSGSVHLPAQTQHHGARHANVPKMSDLKPQALGLWSKCTKNEVLYPAGCLLIALLAGISLHMKLTVSAAERNRLIKLKYRAVIQETTYEETQHDHMRLGELLCAAHIITENELEHALDVNAGMHGLLGETLMYFGWASSAQITAALLLQKRIANKKTTRTNAILQLQSQGFDVAQESDSSVFGRDQLDSVSMFHLDLPIVSEEQEHYMGPNSVPEDICMFAGLPSSTPLQSPALSGTQSDWKVFVAESESGEDSKGSSDSTSESKQAQEPEPFQLFTNCEPAGRSNAFNSTAQGAFRKEAAIFASINLHNADSKIDDNAIVQAVVQPTKRKQRSNRDAKSKRERTQRPNR